MQFDSVQEEVVFQDGSNQRETSVAGFARERPYDCKTFLPNQHRRN